MLFLPEPSRTIESVPSEPLAVDELALLRSYATKRIPLSAYGLYRNPGLNGFEIFLALTAPLALALPLIGLLSLLR